MIASRFQNVLQTCHTGYNMFTSSVRSTEYYLECLNDIYGDSATTNSSICSVCHAWLGCKSFSMKRKVSTTPDHGSSCCCCYYYDYCWRWWPRQTRRAGGVLTVAINPGGYSKWRWHSWLRTYLIFIWFTLWGTVLWQQHQLLQLNQQQQQQQPSRIDVDAGRSILYNSSNTRNGGNRDGGHDDYRYITPNQQYEQKQEQSDHSTLIAIDGYFNGIPVVLHRPSDTAGKLSSPTRNSLPQPTHHQPPAAAAAEAGTTSTKTPFLYSDWECNAAKDWPFRSCRFHNLCWDWEQNDFVLLVDPALAATSTNYPSSTSSTNHYQYNTDSIAVALGGINPRWDISSPGEDPRTKGSWKMKWSPRFVTVPTAARNPSVPLDHQWERGHYQQYKLPTHVVLVPFHSMAAHNVGHLVWDDLYPIFRLLRQWDLIPDRSDGTTTAATKTKTTSNTPIQLLLLRVPSVNNNQSTPLYASCEIRRSKRIQCRENFNAFLQPILGVDPVTFTTTRQIQWQMMATTIHPSLSLQNTGAVSSPTSSATNPLICAATAVAGIGMLTDHGYLDHGWDYSRTNSNGNINSFVPHNIGHARDFWEFGKFALHNTLSMARTAMPPSTTVTTTPTVQEHPTSPQAVNNTFEPPNDDRRRIVFAMESSRDLDRRLTFTEHREALRRVHIAAPLYHVEAVHFWNLSVTEQIQLAHTTDIFVAACGGGGALPVTFLPRGSSAIIFYNPRGGYDYHSGSRRPEWPVRLDWDLLQHAAAHIHVHWLPIRMPSGLGVGGGTTSSSHAGISRTEFSPTDIELFVRLVRHELDTMVE